MHSAAKLKLCVIVVALAACSSAVDPQPAAVVDASLPPADAAVIADSGPPPALDAGAGLDAASAADSGSAQSVLAIAAPPSYLGTTGGADTCSKSYRTTGFAPTDAARHPLFLYFVGTEIVSADQSSKYDSQAAAKVTSAMARRGFVSLSVEYDNQLGSFLNNKFPCLFGPTADSLIAKACALPDVDCALGIATWGHSQGALLAHGAANFEPRVRAVWTTGYGGFDSAQLPPTRLRVVNGEADTMNASLTTLNKTAGFSNSECPDDGRSQCLRADGSGWLIVRKTDCQVTAADHCWFDKKSCSENQETLEPNWVSETSQTGFALEANADWLARTAARP